MWKGLFYCFWMSDKPLVQHELADRLSMASLPLPLRHWCATTLLTDMCVCVCPGGLIHVLDSDRMLMFVRAFWETMAREWTGRGRPASLEAPPLPLRDR